MGNGDRAMSHWSFHIPRLHNHHHHHEHDHERIPKGCLAVKVGQGEEQERFVIPVLYFNHPLFGQLLKEAEEEFGFAQKGTITIPCHVEEFRYVRGLIDRENTKFIGHNLFDHHHHHHQNHLIRCFRV
ncbi:PREDICTED: auxin-responsive protein SAUR32 [Camelina sativa]|uniref:Auxin-responsive protein SAUR32 n=1 Tax=Camelina sativa TaxID=90675 RepID=A0ABM0T944_CAMSA|nr:PREDICTED: auxin-responsive protein SAUR32 [Camelina sativa]